MLSQIDRNRYFCVFVPMIFVGLLLCLFSPNYSPAKPILEKPFEQSDQESALRIRKLQAEIRDLEIKTENNSSWISNIPAYTTSISTLVAVIGLLIAAVKYLREYREEHQRRFVELYPKIVEYIGSDINAGAGVVLLTNFIKPEYKDINSQVMSLIMSFLKKNLSTDVRKQLVQSFEKTLRSELNKGEPWDIDFSSLYLARVNLSSLSLTCVDFNNAVLGYANLNDSNLYRSKGRNVNLEKALLSGCNLEEVRFVNAILVGATLRKARLVSAKFKNSDARCAQFQQAKLQGAHFENSELEGAQFQEANLSDAYFYGASFDDVALKSIACNKEKLWLTAHFDKDIEEKLKWLKKEAETTGNVDAS